MTIDSKLVNRFATDILVKGSRYYIWSQQRVKYGGETNCILRRIDFVYTGNPHQLVGLCTELSNPTWLNKLEKMVDPVTDGCAIYMMINPLSSRVAISRCLGIIGKYIEYNRDLNQISLKSMYHSELVNSKGESRFVDIDIDEPSKYEQVVKLFNDNGGIEQGTVKTQGGYHILVQHGNMPRTQEFYKMIKNMTFEGVNTDGKTELKEVASIKAMRGCPVPGTYQNGKLVGWTRKSKSASEPEPASGAGAD